MPTVTSFLDIRRKFDQIFIKPFYMIWCICLYGGAAVTTGLTYTQRFVDIAVVGVLITYFTDTWKGKEHNLPIAVAMINLLEGLSSVLELAMTYISDNHGPLIVILCSTAAYIIGMVMLCISAFHPIAGDMTGMYFVLVVLLIAVGKAGGVPVLEGFLVGQLTAHEPRLDKDEWRVNAKKTLWLRLDKDEWGVIAKKILGWITALLLCGFIIARIFGSAGWRFTFMVSTLVMGIGYFLFLCCIPLYHHRSVDEAATTSEISRASPEENTNNVPTPADSARRRLKEQWKHLSVKWKHLSVKWKHLSVMIPMWTTFLVFGLVLSTGNTVFTEQGNNMHATVSIYILILIRTIIKDTLLSSSFSTILLKYIPKPLKTKSIIVGILTAMVVSVFCCSVAWRVEIRRLRTIEDFKFCVKFNQDDHAVVPMSILHLVPQFCLLGLMEGIGKQGLNLFFEVQVPRDVPVGKYGSALNEAVIGFGSFINALLVYSLKSWFGDTLICNSRLDIYYQILMILSFLNLCCYGFVTTRYWNKKETRDDVEGNQEMV